MNEEIEKLINKARRSLKAARVLYKEGYYDFSVSRAYYAMSYCSECLLLTKGMSFSKHSAIISAIGKYFVKTGLLPSRIHTNILNAFRERQIGDYDVIKDITKSEASLQIKNAKDFINLTIKYLKENSYEI